MSQLSRNFYVAIQKKDDEYVVIGGGEIVDDKAQPVSWKGVATQMVFTKPLRKMQGGGHQLKAFCHDYIQNYFRMYNKLAGMTGTAETEAGELWEIYKLDVVAAVHDQSDYFKT